MTASTLSTGTPVRMDLPEFYDGDGYYDTLARLRREEPVFWHEEGDFWVLTRPEHLHSMDLPDHKGVRNVFRDQFTPRAIQRLQDMVDELARAAFDNADGSSDEIDFVPTIAWQVPMDAIAILMGLPRADWQNFRRWSEVALAITVPKDAEAKAREKVELNEFYGYLRDHVAHRREHPADDLITCMAQARIDDEYLPDYQVAGHARWGSSIFQNTLNALPVRLG